MLYVTCCICKVVIGGMLRGSGRQYIGAIMNFIGYYVIGIPLGIVLALKVNRRPWSVDWNVYWKHRSCMF